MKWTLTLLALATVPVAATLTVAPTSAFADTTGWGCYSYTQGRSFPHGTELDSPTYAGSGHHTCRDGEWVFTPHNCYVTEAYGDYGTYERQYWVEHGTKDYRDGHWQRCHDGRMIAV
jgi:hypothetical protein